MCEWLSYGEWCDVKLLCGGRSFNAHRAVLASVSTFLRQILLSCQTDESPTFIVLPDFDIDAMSSVLYYIYNGEVVVQRQKLDMFLDIIRAMQIFIDYQYLGPKLRGYTPNTNLDLNINNCEFNLPKNEVFTLGFGDYKDQRYVKIRKGMEVKDVLHYALTNSDPPDKRVRCRNQSERRNSLGNLKTPYRDRQKNSFLRDLFIETYPRNGNVNGQTEGVLAISNESYRAPASLLLTNANGGHLSTGDTLLETYKNTTGFSFHSPIVSQPGKQLQWAQNNNHSLGEIYSGTFPDSQCVNVCSKEIDLNSFYKNQVSNTFMKHSLMNNISAQTNLSLPSKGLREQTVAGVSTLDLSITQSISDTAISSLNFNSDPLIPNKSLFINFIGDRSKQECRSEADINNSPKATIHNHVLKSPWCPHIPSNFKPFRRKIQDLDYSRTYDQKEDKEDIVSDSNNNVHSSVSSKLTEKVSATDGAKVTKPSVAITSVKDDLKCTVCNQVFTSRETLSAHTRRHSANARYSCGECGKTFSQLRNFKYHMSIHRGTREFAATCTVCGKYFNDRGYLSSHMKIHRNRKEYKCSMCPKSFNQRVAYNMHVRIHTGVKPHVCEECGKAFSRKMLLKQHQRTHSGERPYACPHCDKRFADRSNMTLHLRLHTGVKPFSCSLCPKSFTKKHHLKSHLNFHTGSKPYSCPRCHLAFTQSSNMRTHLKKCSAPDPMHPSTVLQS